MWTMFWVGLGMISLGFAIAWLKIYSKPNIVIGCSVIFGGVILLVGAAISHDVKLENARIDLKNRTTIITDVVIESHEVHGCLQSFVLNRDTSYPFEVGCSSNVEPTFSQPKVGDVMRVKFVRPKEPVGKPEILEVYNLTQKIEQVLGTPLCATPEAQPISPEAPARSRSRTLPAPRAE
jgi:hypothetical protein